MMIAQATSSFAGSSSAASRCSSPLMVDTVTATVLMVLLLGRVQTSADVAA